MSAEHPTPSWTMGNLYDAMMDALKLFGLGIHEINKVKVSAIENEVQFSYRGRVISLNINH